MMNRRFVSWLNILFTLMLAGSPGWLRAQDPRYMTPQATRLLTTGGNPATDPDRFWMRSAIGAAAQSDLTAAQSGLNELGIRSPSALRLNRFKNAIAAYRLAGVGAASWLFYGDSISESFWSPEAQLEFGRRYGLRGFWIDLGVQTYGTASIRFSSGISSGTTERLDGYALSPTGRTYVMTGSGQGVQFRPNAANVPDFAPNKYTIVYARQSGGGIFKVQTLSLAGGDSDAYWTDVPGMTAVDTSNATLQLATLEVPLAAASATNRVRCMWVSGGSAEIVGALCENTAAAGIVMTYFSRGGLDMSQTAAISSANLGVLLNLIRPDLIHWAMKDADLAAKLVAHQALWDAAYPTSWLYSTPYPSESQTESQVRTEADIVINHAKANGKEWWDSLPYLPNYSMMAALGIATDGTHLTSQGTLFMQPRIQRDTGLFPDAREGGQPASAPVFSSVTATDLVLSGRSQREANQDAATAARIMAGGVRIPQGVNAKVANQLPLTAVGTDSFTLVGFVKVPDTPVSIQMLALRTSTAGTGNQDGTLVLSATSTTFRIVMRTPASATVNFGADTLASTFWANAGKVIMVGVRRDMAAPADAAKFNLIIGSDIFPANGPNTTDAGSSLAATYVIAGAVAGSSVAYDLFGAAYYNSALTDAQIRAISRAGVFPAGALVQWDMAYSGSATSAADRSGNTNPGMLLFGAQFTKPIVSAAGGYALADDVFTLALSRQGGIRVPSGSAGRVINQTAFTAVGASSFTVLTRIRVPDTAGSLEIIGLRNSTAGGQQNGTVILSASATAFSATLRDGAGNSHVFGGSSLGPKFWTHAGKMLLVGVRRDTATIPKISLIIGSVTYPDNAPGDPAASESLTATFMTAGAVAGTASRDCEFYGAAYYNSALTDSQIQQVAESGAVIPGAAVSWDMMFSPGGGAQDISGNGNFGVLYSGAVWTRPQYPVITQVIPNSVVAGTNQSYVWTSGNSNLNTTPLPAAARYGDTLEIIGKASGGWRITQAAGQQIVEGAGGTVGTNATTAGTGGHLGSSGRYDSVMLRCLDDTGLLWGVVRRNGTLSWF